MIGATIGLLLRNLPAVLFVLALALAAIRHDDEKTVEHFLSWILLLPIGVTGLWAGLTHVFFPDGRRITYRVAEEPVFNSKSAWSTSRWE